MAKVRSDKPKLAKPKVKWSPPSDEELRAGGPPKEWDNTRFALGEDWELNYNLESTRYSAIEVFYKFVVVSSQSYSIQIFNCDIIRHIKEF